MTLSAIERLLDHSPFLLFFSSNSQDRLEDFFDSHGYVKSKVNLSMDKKNCKELNKNIKM